MPKSSKKKPLTRSQKIKSAIKRPFVYIRKRADGYLERRPHRSFRISRRRDYRRSLQLPNVFSFTMTVNKTLWQHRKKFFLLAGLYAGLTALLVGIGSQDTYLTLRETLESTGSEMFQGGLGELGRAGLLFLSVASTGLTAAPTESQQVYAILVGLLVWLTTVWLLRNILAGHTVRVRDGLYNAGAPIISTFLVAIVLVLQLIPIGLAYLAYNAANATNLLSGGIEALLFWVVAGLLGLVSVYLVTSTFFALIIVTLPGMYPMKALRTAGDMVVGRRLRILARILWMLLCIAIGWVLILIPFILLDGGLKTLIPAISWLPIVPFVLMILGVLSVLWGAGYIYLLYRRVVDDDAKPA